LTGRPTVARVRDMTREDRDLNMRLAAQQLG
jgi:hypothetical protein